MSVHFIHDLGQDSLIKPYTPVGVVCGVELREAHEIVAPESEADVCPECLSWSRRNKYQNRRCAVERSASVAASGPVRAPAEPPISSETDAG
jgi:ribosome-binding protein aMBF1 (putative translation factor)